ncbi:hypothetical protein [Streptomyces sp. NRRL S-1521]|uniref:hypothetical protein n=1 Tax=Streptomyces sp. NRRL S-1521 TaxID=1609100 RepID=UPI0007495070|nr:hypothetical protein [Streptomyces sp. NRRL S-1521]KUL50502.1 hypothetical protein ADL30_29730 [Streptomyces sp. NRRL S-1521]
MPTRVRTLRSPLVALLLAVLGLGMFCAPAVAARTAASAADPVPAAESVSVSAPGHDRPGCGQGERRDGLDDPAQSPRPSTSHELLPALAEAHGGGGSWAGDPAFLDLTPVRGPPEPLAPSPYALSVLRV